MARPRISLITPSYNQGPYLRRTIDSILSQRGEFELDYRVFDGGSKDDTVEILRSYGDRVRWTSAKDKGQVDAINKGLRAVDGEIVGWVNSDDLLLPGALDRVARAFAEHPGVEWVHGRCKIIDEHDHEIRRWVSLYKHVRCKTHSFASLLTENYVSQMTAFWRRSVHDEIGYLDPAVDLSFDYDLFLRLARRGDPIYLDEPVACFRMYDTSKSGAGYVKQIDQAHAIAARYATLTPYTRARMAAKKAAVVQVYKAMGLARAAVARLTA